MYVTLTIFWSPQVDWDPVRKNIMNITQVYACTIYTIKLEELHQSWNKAKRQYNA